MKTIVVFLALMVSLSYGQTDNPDRYSSIEIGLQKQINDYDISYYNGKSAPTGFLLKLIHPTSDNLSINIIVGYTSEKIDFKDQLPEQKSRGILLGISFKIYLKNEGYSKAP